MKEVIVSLRFRLVLAMLALALGWMLMGPIGVVFFSPLAGVCLARPLLEKMARIFYGAKEAALEDLQGLNYSFRGIRLEIHIDQQNQCWLRTSDVRNLVPSFPRDGVLAKICSDGLMPENQGGSGGLRVRSDALNRLLSNSQQLETIKFRNWLQREVIFPAKQRAARGIPPPSRRSKRRHDNEPDPYSGGGLGHSDAVDAGGGD